MQIGVLVNGFADIDGVLHYTVLVKFTHPLGIRGEVGGTIPLTSNPAQVSDIVKRWIVDGYGVAVPNNATIKVLGL